MYNKAPALFGVAIALFVLVSLVVAGRIYVRLFVKRNLRRDDTCYLLAFGAYTALTIVLLHAIAYDGLGQHITSVSMSQYSHGIKDMLAAEMIYAWTTSIIKVAFGLTLLRLASTRSHMIAIYGIMIFTLASTLIYFFVALFTCKPVEFLWTRFLGASEGTCHDLHFILSANYAHGAMVIIQDLALSLLPIFILQQQKLSTTQKLLAAALILVSTGATISAIARIALAPGLKNPDFLWTSANIAGWTLAEAGISIIATGLASLQPLLAGSRLTKSCEETQIDETSDDEFKASAAKISVTKVRGGEKDTPAYKVRRESDLQSIERAYFNTWKC